MKSNSTLMSKSIDGILSIMYVGFHNEKVNTSGIFDPSISFTVYDAKEAIYDLILSEVIEEDVYWSTDQRRKFSTNDIDSFAHLFAVNNEKKERRQKLAQLFGREG